MLHVMCPLILKRTLRDGGFYLSYITDVKWRLRGLCNFLSFLLLTSILSILYEPHPILSAVDTAVSQTNRNLCPHGRTMSQCTQYYIACDDCFMGDGNRVLW